MLDIDYILVGKPTAEKSFIFISNIQNAKDWQEYFKEEYPEFKIHFFKITLPEHISIQDLESPSNPTELTANKIYELIKQNNIPKDIPLMAHGVGGRVAVYLNLQKGVGSHLIIFATRFFKRVFLRERIHNMLAKSKHTKWLAKIVLPSLYDTKLLTKLLIKLRHEDLSSLLPQIEVPTLLVWGDKDDISPIVNGIEAHKLIKDSLFRVITDGNHFVPFKPVPQALKELILDFTQNNYAS